VTRPIGLALTGAKVTNLTIQSTIFLVKSVVRIAPKVLLPEEGGGKTGNDTLRQKRLLPWREWIKA
jgi:hypothetical protein